MLENQKEWIAIVKGLYTEWSTMMCLGTVVSLAWHTVHATKIEIDQSELSTRGKLSFPTS